MADNLSFVVTAKNEASKVLNQAKKSIANFDKNVKKSSRNLKKWAKDNERSFQKMRNVGAIALGAVVLSIRKVTNEASDLKESINAVNVVFKDGADEVLGYAKDAATSVGLAQREYNQMATITGALLKDVGLPMAEVAELTNDLTVRAADMASVFNTDVSDAMGAITQALRGETEAIRRYAGDVTDATLETFRLSEGMQKSVKDMNQQEKRLLRVALIMEQTKDTAGDFANTSGELANQQRILSAQFKDIAADLGSSFIPMFQNVLGVINPLVSKFAEWSKENPDTAKNILLVSGAVALLVTGIGLLGLALPGIIQGMGFLRIAMGLGGGLAGAGLLAVGILIGLEKVITSTDEKIAVFSATLAELTKQYEAGTISGEDYIIQSLALQQQIKETEAQAKTFGQTLKDDVNEGLQAILNPIESTKEAFKSLGIIWDTVTLGIGNAIDTMLSALNDFGVRVDDFLGGLVDRAFDWGLNLIDMLRQGIMEGVARLGEAVKGVASTIKDYLGFGSPTEKGPAKDSDQWAPAFMQMFSDGIIKNYSKIRNASKGAAAQIENSFENMKENVMVTLVELEKDFEDTSKKLKENAKNILNEIGDLKRALTQETASDEIGLAEEFVKSKDLITSLEKDLSSAKEELSGADSEGEKARLQEEVDFLQSTLDKEMLAYENASALRAQLSDEITEVERRNALTNLEREIEDFNTRRLQRTAEFNEKKLLLQQEVTAIAQQHALLEERYKQNKEAIMEQYRLALNEYVTLLDSQTAITQEKTTEMVGYFNSVASAIRALLVEQERAGVAGLAFADGGVAEGGFTPFASGGVVTKPTLGLVGEGSSNEAIVPLPNGRSIPVEMRGGNNGGSTYVININGPIQGFDVDTAEEIMDIGVQQFMRKEQFENF